jgi:predicted Zn-dependent peptidase
LADRYYQYTLPNGMTLLGEKMPAMQSAAMTLLIPAGAAADPRGASGTGTVLSELVLRGAGVRDSRQLTDYLDSLGLQRSASTGIQHTRFGSAALAPRVMEALPAYADILRRPHLPEGGFQAARDLAIQALEGIEDEPRQKVLIKLREWHFPWPFGRNTMGEMDDLKKLTLGICRMQHTQRYRPGGAILALAGNIDFDEVRRAAEAQFGDWEASAVENLELIPPPGRVCHEEHPSEQTHIGLAWPSIQETDPAYYEMRLAIEVLSGGMSGRLFTEVREKRGLVYNVWAGYTSLKGYGSIMGYAGTSNDRAQATLDTFIAEVQRLGDGVTAAELDRAKIGLKAATVMQGESTSARAGSIAHDFFMRGRIRTLEEVIRAIDQVTLDQVNAYVKKNQPGPFTLVTVGPKELTVPQ